MGLLDRFRKGGGGFLNNVDGLITAFRFTTDPDFGGKTFDASKAKMLKLWAAVTVLVDGSTKPETVHLDAGDSDGLVISEDGQALTPATEEAMLWGNTPFMKFYESAVNAPNGITDVEPEEDGTLNFGGLVGVRTRFVQVKDEEADAKLAKWVKANPKKAAGKYNEAGERKGKDGKYYGARNPQVTEVYSTGNDVSGAVAARPTTTTTSPTKRGTAAPVAPRKAKGNGHAADVAIVGFSKTTLYGILEAAKGNTITVRGLNMAVTRALPDDPRREAVRTYLCNE